MIRDNYKAYREGFQKVKEARDQRNKRVLNVLNPMGLSMRERLTDIMVSALSTLHAIRSTFYDFPALGLTHTTVPASVDE